MGFEISWLVEGRVLYARMQGVVSNRDDEQFDDAVGVFLNGANGLPVHLITDYSSVERVETVISPTHAVESNIARHPALGIRLTSGTQVNPIARYFTPFVSTLLKPGSQRFATRDNALDYLYASDPTLPAPGLPLSHNRPA